jgi:hypothetical protein
LEPAAAFGSPLFYVLVVDMCERRTSLLEKLLDDAIEVRSLRCPTDNRKLICYGRLVDCAVYRDVSQATIA